MAIKIWLNKVFGRLPKKDRQSIYHAAIELRNLQVWWTIKLRDLNKCKLPYSSSADRLYGLGYETACNGIIGYIEQLENRIKELEHGS